MNIVRKKESRKEKLPADLQELCDKVIRAFTANKTAPEELEKIYQWLELDSWDALIADLGEQTALKLGYLAKLRFNDAELRASMDIPVELSVADADRLAWGRGHIDRVLAGDDEQLLPGLHTYTLEASDGSTAVLGCLVEVQGQGGPVFQWQGLWPSRESFLATLSQSYDYWVTPLMGDVPDAVILSLWQETKSMRKNSSKSAEST
jgi:hypothetical protein